MSDLIKEIKDKRDDIEKLKQDKSRLEGQYDTQMKRLKDEFALDSIDEAEAECEKLNVEVEKLDAALAKDETELRAIMEE